jgi:hypothetical protein
MTPIELEAMKEIGEAISDVANAIKPHGTTASQDASSGYVSSLTETGIGITAGLIAVAGEIHEVSEALRVIASNMEPL